jgi:UDP-N-acetylmuramoyl-tripeptide--D-alanyl-D-alanine ligase
MDIHDIYAIYKKFPSVQTDTRKLKKGDIFFALKGSHFNGNEYVQKALELGACYCIADENTGVSDSRIILVDDVLETLQLLAKKHREQFTIPFIAVTGSNGKTTTKELIHVVLSSTYKTYTTEGNLNNHIGIPLTILKIRPDAEIAVIEMGANHQKEIEGYCKYALPTHAVITNCGKAHLEGFGGEEGVRKGKGELYDFIRQHEGTVFLYDDYDYLQNMSKGIAHIIKYGTNERNVALCGNIKNDNHLLEVEIKKGAEINIIQTQLIGGYNLPNVLAAVCIGKTFSVADHKIKTAIESYQPSNSRSQLIHSGTNEIILDAYNANPSSMQLAIENFSRMSGDNKILMLGAMMELGEESRAEHLRLIETINQYVWKCVLLVGKQFEGITENHLYFEKTEQARQWFVQQKISDSKILIKGSRSIQMEKIIE